MNKHHESSYVINMNDINDSGVMSVYITEAWDQQWWTWLTMGGSGWTIGSMSIIDEQHQFISRRIGGRQFLCWIWCKLSLSRFCETIHPINSQGWLIKRWRVCKSNWNGDHCKFSWQNRGFVGYVGWLDMRGSWGIEKACSLIGCMYLYISKRQNYCNTNLVFDAPWPFRVA